METNMIYGQIEYKKIFIQQGYYNYKLYITHEYNVHVLDAYCWYIVIIVLWAR